MTVGPGKHLCGVYKGQRTTATSEWQYSFVYLFGTIGDDATGTCTKLIKKDIPEFQASTCKKQATGSTFGVAAVSSILMGMMALTDLY